ncbi:MAG: ankyrin repeat domain-containing protein, partial [Smithellaceae bacterium]|nr:ankyrin repeat domain-containing protein [Smithellaceae bacterium]
MQKGSKNILAVILVALITITGCAGPLLTAAQKGNDQEVKALLDSGANASLKEEGRTPLITAIWYRHSSTAKLLIERGADVNQPAIVIDGYDPPLTVAAVRDNSEIINLLINKGADLEYALSVCHQKSNAFMVGYLYKRCQAILRPVQIKQEAAKAQDTFKNGPAKTAQSAVESTTSEREKHVRPSSVPSDV